MNRNSFTAIRAKQERAKAFWNLFEYHDNTEISVVRVYVMIHGSLAPGMDDSQVFASIR